MTKRRWSIGALGVLAIAAQPARANVGQPSFPGDPTGEPHGIHGIAIADEQLAIDLRPLNDGEPVHISATYHLVNYGAPQQLDLVFASGARDISDFAVSLDTQPVTGATPHAGVLPPDWQAPAATPGLDGGTLSFELDRDAGAVSFPLAVPAGAHALTVTYRARPLTTVRTTDSPTMIYQVAYVLAPARTWDGFGTLDATIALPSGWQIATTPAFTRAGAALHAHFAGLPADSIALTARAPAGALYGALHIIGALLTLAVFAGGALLLWRRGMRRARHARHASALLGGLSWSAALFASALFEIFAPSYALPANQASSVGYAPAVEAMLAFMLALVACLLGALLARFAWKRAQPGP